MSNHRPPIATAMRRYDPEETVDAVVIGTGAGGAPILARLATAGLRVVALEAGPWWTPEQDFATDELAQSDLFWTDERLTAGNDPIAFGNNNSGKGVGGTTLHYTAYTPRPRPEDFRLHTDTGLGVDWPMSYDDLRPYYDEVETFLGISGPSPYPWEPTRQPYKLGPLPINAPGQLMARGCDAVGIRWSAAANAALSAPYFQPGVGWRAACTNRGFCQAGCSNGAKASIDVTYLPVAIHAGAEIRPNCFVTGFERAADGRITGVIYTENGQEARQNCRHVFLCAGAVETPRLLLLNDLATESGQVGRNLMAHVAPQVFGLFPEETRPNKGITGALISEDHYRRAHADFVGGYIIQSIGIMPLTYATQLARGRGLWGQALRDQMRGYNHVAGINVLGDCLPHPDNRLTLSDERDGRGLPKPLATFSYGDNERAMEKHAETVMREIWQAAGATDLWTFPRSAHVIGTCRMGTSPDAAVVDPDCRSFSVPNMSICDNSVFPSALGVNPSLTIMALALRTADRFLTTQNA